MKKYKIVNKTRFYLFITLVFTLIAMTFALLTSSIKAHSIILKENYHEFLVIEGDTLWNIALKYKPSKYDVRDMVFKIKELNNMDTSYIFPGEIIKIPIIDK